MIKAPPPGTLESWVEVVRFLKSTRTVRELAPDGMFEKMRAAIMAYTLLRRRLRAWFLEEVNDLLKEYGVWGPKFHLGLIVATPQALAVLSTEDILAALRRHVSGDWGDLDAHDRDANERALLKGERLLSVYRSAGGVRFYVITERNRTLTTVLLPEDY